MSCGCSFAKWLFYWGPACSSGYHSRLRLPSSSNRCCSRSRLQIRPGSQQQSPCSLLGDCWHRSFQRDGRCASIRFKLCGMNKTSDLGRQLKDYSGSNGLRSRDELEACPTIRQKPISRLYVDRGPICESRLFLRKYKRIRGCTCDASVSTQP